jgi:hypothetical protein
MVCIVPIPKRVYTTSFVGNNENPLSETGNWLHLEPTLTNVQTGVINGVRAAFGTQTGLGSFDDSNAYLIGFRRDHEIEGIIALDGTIAATPNAEVELLLSWSDQNSSIDYGLGFGATLVRGYEFNYQHQGAYAICGRFKGPELFRITTPAVPAHGDKFRARIIHNADGTADITPFWNDVTQALTLGGAGGSLINGGTTYHDPTPSVDGDPGIGFFIDNGQVNNKFGFSRVTAREL